MNDEVARVPREGMSPEETYATLRNAIVVGKLQPNERLVEADLVQSLGAGRAAIRTALVRLEQERLVERERNRGARVRMVFVIEAIEILEARSVLEGLIARKAAERVTSREAKGLRADLSELKRRLDRGDLLAASDANAAFHQRIMAIAHHGTAERLISSLHSQMVRFQYRTILIPGRSTSSFQEHSAIAEAILDRNPKAAEQAMRRHLSKVAEALRSADDGGVSLPG